MELMAEGQWKRWDAVARLGAEKLTLQEAARVLGLSVRQVRRIRRAVERAGRAGLRHGNAGQVPVNKLRAAVRHRILRLRAVGATTVGRCHNPPKSDVAPSPGAARHGGNLRPAPWPRLRGSA